ncbi:MAG: hemerythrin domain-containing protein [Rhodocyclales bacterium]|nr:hemerythrin domain-containing protein [Rhodocyclales bacterium]
MTSPPATTLPVDFEIGIAELDAQHKRLHGLLERLREAVGKHYGFATIAILDELSIEARIHFAVEESLMRMLSFPEVGSHITEHENLRGQLEKFRKRAQDFEVADDLAAFIQQWLNDHVDRFDRDFVDHFLRAGVDPRAAPESP